MRQLFKRLANLSTSELRGILLVILGIIALGFYYSWWFMEERLASPYLFIGFMIALFYGGIQIFGSWLLYLATHYHSKPPSSFSSTSELTIDVFVTACGEDHTLIEQALRGACKMDGQHRTWLLDDGDVPALARMAERLGAGYLTRANRQDAKAGNINAALARTDGDIIVIFDIDHVPKADFLTRSLGYFTDPQLGFVQVMLTFKNEQDGWVAEAASQSSMDFYNPASIGADGLKGATLIGSNALIRRQALLSIDGYQPGLAEDLATSIALHAAGWRSAYLAQPLAPGIAPPDLPAWFTQQLKWARGVFELLLTAYPRYFLQLNTGQRISYAVRMTYYWIGPVICIHLLLTLACLLSIMPESHDAFESYLLHLAPLATITLLIRQLALRKWRHRSIKHNLQLKPIMLVYVTWPIYTLAWLMAVLRLPLSFRPTPKNPTGDLNPRWLLPQVVTVLLLAGGLFYSLIIMELNVLLFGFTALQAIFQAGLLRQFYRSAFAKERSKAMDGHMQKHLLEIIYSQKKQYAEINRFTNSLIKNILKHSEKKAQESGKKRKVPCKPSILSGTERAE